MMLEFHSPGPPPLLVSQLQLALWSMHSFNDKAVVVRPASFAGQLDLRVDVPGRDSGPVSAPGARTHWRVEMRLLHIMIIIKDHVAASIRFSLGNTACLPFH